jgi:molybdopterin converting factor small subunit
MHLQVELWMWLGTRLGDDFESPSEMRSTKEMEVEGGLTVIQLFDRLASRYPLIEEKIFSRRTKKFQANLSVIVTHDGRVVSPFDIEEDILKEGNKVTVLPLYAGG